MCPTLITNILLFDGKSHWPGTHNLLIKDGYIASIDAPSTTEVNIVDGTGCTLLPGLIDTHVHCTTIAHLCEFGRHGVTTVIDLGTKEDVRALRHHGLPTVSCYLSAGIPAAARGATQVKVFSLADQDIISNPYEAPEFVRSRVEDNSDFIKLFADVPGFALGVLRALCDASRSAGRRTIAHALQRESYERALAAGCDVITHMPLDTSLDSAMANDIRNAGVAVSPTLIAMQVLTNVKTELSFSAALKSTTALHEAGVMIVAGTDANTHPGFEISFGDSMHTELRLLVQAGLAPTEALAAATGNAAEAFQLKDRGIIEVGKRADLVLVAGNPTQNIQDVAMVRGVWIGGEAVTL